MKNTAIDTHGALERYVARPSSVGLDQYLRRLCILMQNEGFRGRLYSTTPSELFADHLRVTLERFNSKLGIILSHRCDKTGQESKDTEVSSADIVEAIAARPFEFLTVFRAFQRINDPTNNVAHDATFISVLSEKAMRLLSGFAEEVSTQYYLEVALICPVTGASLPK